MTREEFRILVKGMRAVYSDPKFIADKDAFDIWYSMLNDLPYDVASMAVQTYMMTEKFPPTIADIRNQCVKNQNRDEMSEAECWAIVSKAIRDSAYHAQEHFDSFPEDIKKAIGSADVLRSWGMDCDYNELVAQSQFYKCLKEVRKRKEEIKALPTRLQELLTSTSQMMIEG